MADIVDIKTLDFTIDELEETLDFTIDEFTGEGVTAQAKTATPYTTQQTVLPDSGYDYLSQVTVEAIYYNESANAYGTTVTIGTVAP